MWKIKIKGFDEVQEILKEYREGGALELQQYRAIGTVEECREARERQSPKKPKGRYQTRYMWDAAYCPVCDCGITARWNFCQRCGQSIEWSKGDVDEN